MTARIAAILLSFALLNGPASAVEPTSADKAPTSLSSATPARSVAAPRARLVKHSPRHSYQAMTAEDFMPHPAEVHLVEATPDLEINDWAPEGQTGETAVFSGREKLRKLMDRHYRGSRITQKTTPLARAKSANSPAPSLELDNKRLIELAILSPAYPAWASGFVQEGGYPCKELIVEATNLEPLLRCVRAFNQRSTP